MRRIAILLLLPLLAVLLAEPVIARKPDGASGRLTAGSKVKLSPKVTVTVATSEQGALDIDASPASGPSTLVTINYRVENDSVVESTACIGQFDAASGGSLWGCGAFSLSALTIGRRVSRATLEPVSIPVDRCTADGSCTAGSVTVSAALTSLRDSYQSGGNRTESRIAGCKVVTTNSWEETAAVGVLTVDGTTYSVEPRELSAGQAFRAISRAPSVTRTTCY